MIQKKIKEESYERKFFKIEQKKHRNKRRNYLQQLVSFIVPTV